MASVIKRSYGTVDYKLGELRYFRTHVYSTLVAMTADVTNAEGRIVYNLETGRHYFGKSGSWVGLGAPSSLVDSVPDVASLPPTGNTAGDIIVTVDGGDGKPSIYGWDGSAWFLLADHKIILSNGTIEFTAIPSVTDADTVMVTVPKNLTTKKYVDDADAAHLAAPDPHDSQALVDAHNVDGGSHADMRTPLFDHIAAPAPHSGHETPAGANAKIAVHNADAGAHGGVATTTYVDTAIATAILADSRSPATTYAGNQVLDEVLDVVVTYTGSGGHTFTLPAANVLGANFSELLHIKNIGTGDLSVVPAGADTIFSEVVAAVTLTMHPGDSALLRSDGVSVWLAAVTSYHVKIIVDDVLPLVDTATILTDATLNSNFSVTLAASRTMANPTGLTNGQTICYEITQGGTGTNLVTWDTLFNFGADVPTPVLSITVGLTDYIFFRYNGTKLNCLAVSRGYAP
jgi:hypothetical protein